MKKIVYIVFLMGTILLVAGCRCTYFAAGSPAHSSITFGFVSNTKEVSELKSMLSHMKVLVNGKEFKIRASSIKMYENVSVNKEKDREYVSHYESHWKAEEGYYKYKSYIEFSSMDNFKNPSSYGMVLKENNIVAFIFESGKRIDIKFNASKEEPKECYEDWILVLKDNFEVFEAGKPITFYLDNDSSKRYPEITIEI